MVTSECRLRLWDDTEHDCINTQSIIERDDRNMTAFYCNTNGKYPCFEMLRAQIACHTQNGERKLHQEVSHLRLLRYLCCRPVGAAFASEDDQETFASANADESRCDAMCAARRSPTIL